MCGLVAALVLATPALAQVPVVASDLDRLDAVVAEIRPQVDQVKQTEGIINTDLLAQLPYGAYVINVARGGHVVDTDLLSAIDSGRIAGATLDVVNDEPLPPGHPYWDHPKIHLTPHIAGLTSPRSALTFIAENLRRLQAGEPVLHQVDPQRQY
jgi:glyoxylate/hydroxypyruvate reductase A